MERLIEEANIQISLLKNELENVKKPGAIVNVRTSTMHPVPCVSSLLQTRTASHVVIPLLNDTDLPPSAQACKGCLSHFNLAVLQPKAVPLISEARCEMGPRISQTGRGGLWRLLLGSVLISGNVGNERTHVVATTRHLTSSSDGIESKELGDLGAFDMDVEGVSPEVSVPKRDRIASLTVAGQ